MKPGRCGRRARVFERPRRGGGVAGSPAGAASVDLLGPLSGAPRRPGARSAHRHPARSCARASPSRSRRSRLSRLIVAYSRTRMRSPGRWTCSRRVPAAVAIPRWTVPRASSSRDAAGAFASPMSAAKRARAASARARRRLRAFGARSARSPRRLVVRGDEHACEHVLRAGHRTQPCAHQAAGRGFGERHALPPRHEHRDDGGLHVVAVDREHEPAEPLAQPRLLPREQGLGRARVLRLGGDAHLDALDAAREEGERRVAEAVELRDASAKRLREPGLALAPGAQHPALDYRAQPRAAAQVGANGALEHLAQLVGHSRHRVDHLLAHRTDEPRGGARHLLDDRSAGGDIRLAQVVLRHPAPAGAEARPDALPDLWVALELHSHDLGDRLAGDVVLGGAEPPADDHRVAAREREAQTRHDAFVVVADLGLEMRVDAGERELLAEPGRVRIDDLAEQQLGADRHHLAAHRGPIRGKGECPRRPALTASGGTRRRAQEPRQVVR